MTTWQVDRLHWICRVGILLILSNLICGSMNKIKRLFVMKCLSIRLQAFQARNFFTCRHETIRQISADSDTTGTVCCWCCEITTTFMTTPTPHQSVPNDSHSSLQAAVTDSSPLEWGSLPGDADICVPHFGMAFWIGLWDLQSHFRLFIPDVLASYSTPMYLLPDLWA